VEPLLAKDDAMRWATRRFVRWTALAIVTLAVGIGASAALTFHSEGARAELKKWRAWLTDMSASDQAAAINRNAKLLFHSPRQAALGNPHGDVTLVEFLDYNCGSCKHALPDMMTLLADDPKLRFVLKEHPVLGPTSSEAAGVAVAVRMQDPSGEKYLAFHRKLLGARGPANQARAMAVAQELGLDMARLERDMTSPEVRETIEENAKLARLLGIKGTPGYVVGDAVVSGEVGVAGLKDKIDAARSRVLN
jgi:protein-disulfide isomerase